MDVFIFYVHSKWLFYLTKMFPSGEEGVCIFPGLLFDCNQEGTNGLHDILYPHVTLLSSFFCIWPYDLILYEEFLTL